MMMKEYIKIGEYKDCDVFMLPGPDKTNTSDESINCDIAIYHQNNENSNHSIINFDLLIKEMSPMTAAMNFIDIIDTQISFEYMEHKESFYKHSPLEGDVIPWYFIRNLDRGTFREQLNNGEFDNFGLGFWSEYHGDFNYKKHTNFKQAVKGGI